MDDALLLLLAVDLALDGERAAETRAQQYGQPAGHVHRALAEGAGQTHEDLDAREDLEQVVVVPSRGFAARFEPTLGLCVLSQEIEGQLA